MMALAARPTGGAWTDAGNLSVLLQLRYHTYPEAGLVGVEGRARAAPPCRQPSTALVPLGMLDLPGDLMMVSLQRLLGQKRSFTANSPT